MPIASVTTSVRRSGHQSAVSFQPGIAGTGTASNGDSGTVAGMTRCGTPSRAAIAAQSRLWRLISCSTARGSPSAATRSSRPGKSVGSTSQTPPPAASACDARSIAGGSGEIQPKPSSLSSQIVIAAASIPSGHATPPRPAAMPRE